MTRERGQAMQNALARYLATWWPYAESAGAGRNGTDVRGTPGVVWECKTAADFKRDFKPTAWVAQSKRHMTEFTGWDGPGQVPVVVYFPVGIGADRVGHTLSILPTNVLVRVLVEAGYAAPERTSHDHGH